MEPTIKLVSCDRTEIEPRYCHLDLFAIKIEASEKVSEKPRPAILQLVYEVEG